VEILKGIYMENNKAMQERIENGTFFHVFGMDNRLFYYDWEKKEIRDANSDFFISLAKMDGECGKIELYLRNEGFTYKSDIYFTDIYFEN
jgi:hypothetical protein